MDSRAARRTAERAARDLIATRAALVGELGVRRADRAQLATAVADATARGRQLVADAEAEAARLLADAQDLARAGEQRYTDAYTAATDGGWAPADLTALGFPPADTSSPRGRRRAPVVHQPQRASSNTMPASTVPAQQTQPVTALPEHEHPQPDPVPAP